YYYRVVCADDPRRAQSADRGLGKVHGHEHPGFHFFPHRHCHPLWHHRHAQHGRPVAQGGGARKPDAGGYHGDFLHHRLRHQIGGVPVVLLAALIVPHTTLGGGGHLWWIAHQGGHLCAVPHVHAHLHPR